MAKLNIVVTKQEIEDAVKAYIFDRVSPGYRFEITESEISFANKEGMLSYFEGSLNAEITPKEQS